MAVLRPRLMLAFFSELPSEEFDIDGTHFVDLGWTSSENTLEREVAGFYDWLRGDGAIRGVRFCPLGAAEALPAQVASLSYVVAGPAGSLDIYFSDNRVYDPASSQDQAFGANRIYRAAEKEFAISFSLDGLEPWELASISNADVVWATMK
jgi:hypothetical protein